MSIKNPVTQAGKQYRRAFIGAMLVYSLVLVIAVSIVNRIGDSPWRFPVILLPVIPLLVALWAFLRYLRQLDELQRRIQFEGFAFSLGMTAFVTVTLGFLERVGFPQIGMIWVAPMLIAFWGIGVSLAARRYR